MSNVWGEHIKIGENTKIGEFVDIGEPDIGDDCKIQCHVSIPPGWKIGNRVFIGPGVHFANDRHPNINKLDFTPELGIVEDDVVIGMGALILPCKIGKGCVIGAGSLVLKDCEAGKTYIGTPARIK